jgi:hypothetical protein
MYVKFTKVIIITAQQFNNNIIILDIYFGALKHENQYVYEHL